MLISLFFMALAITGHAHATQKIDMPETPARNFSCSTTNTWQVLNSLNKKPADALNVDADKTIWAGLITLRSRKPLKLATLDLQWNGPALSRLYASLYQRPKKNSFHARSSHHICNGNWDSTHQKISFALNEKIVSKKTYYLVLGIKNCQEQSLRSGKFALSSPLSTTLTPTQNS